MGFYVVQVHCVKSVANLAVSRLFATLLPVINLGLWGNFMMLVGVAK